MSVSKGKGSDNWVNEYINEVGTYSSEHIGHIGKMNSLLDSMKNSGKSSEKRVYSSFKETVDSFNKYLESNGMELSAYENDKMTAILSSNFDHLVKKRMVEDLIHKIRERIADDKRRQKEEARKAREIEEIKTSVSGIVKWIRLTRFAINYGTITIFSHRLKNQSLNNIKVRAYRSYYPIEKELKSILDDSYHFLSTMEYNSIAALYDLGTALEKVAAIGAAPSFDTTDIFEEISDFSAVYISVLCNASYIEKGLKKIYRDRKPKHGFWGYVWALLDRPVMNNKPVTYTDQESYSKTILGTLKSYYTAFYKAPAVTLNQVMYIAGSDGKIVSDRKVYTPEARQKVESEAKTVKETKGAGENRLRELENLAGRFLEMGGEYFERLFKLKSGSSYTAWLKESEKRPFFRLMKVTESYSRHMLDIITDPENTVVEHDNDLKKNYFSEFPELLKAIEIFNRFLNDIEGSKAREATNFIIPVNEPSLDFISDLMRNSVATSITKPAEGIKPILVELSSHAYNLALRFNDLINTFTLEGKGSGVTFYRTFDYYKNSVVLHPRINSTALAIDSREVLLSDFLEVSCSVAVYIASILCHHGIDAIKREIEIIREKGISVSGEQETSSSSDVPDITQDLYETYTDSITGLKKSQYLEDIILPKYYDENNCLSTMNERCIFCMFLANLPVLNERYGSDAGDQIFRSTISMLNGELQSSGNEDDVAFRSDGGIVFGFINNMNLSQAVDKLIKVLHGIGDMGNSDESPINEDPVVNFGIIKERLDAEISVSMDMVKRVMMCGYDGLVSRIMFPKNPGTVIDSRTLDKGSRECQKILTMVSL